MNKAATQDISNTSTGDDRPRVLDLSFARAQAEKGCACGQLSAQAGANHEGLAHDYRERQTP